MIKLNTLKKFCVLSTMLLLCGLISACGGGGGGGGSSAANNSADSQPASGDSGNNDTSPDQPSSNATVTANLSWEAPGTRENGDKLYPYELGGYEIHYRASGDQEYQTVTISDGDTLQYRLLNLEPGIYEFMMAAFDIDGIYSDFSDLITINLE